MEKDNGKSRNRHQYRERTTASVRKEDLYQSLVKGDVDHANEILGDILSRF